MRKLLLASVAVLGGTVGLAGFASAQVSNNYNNLTTASPPFATPATPATAPLASPGYGTATPGITPMSPGSMSVRIVGRLVAYAGFAHDTGRSANVTSSAAGTTAGTVSTGSPAANTKLAGYGMFEYARLYPSFDAVAANGLKYGAFLEIRQDQNTAAGGGANGSISAAARGRGGLYYRRETGYIGTDNLGFIRFGATDQPTSLMITGNFENFDDGGWNGDPNLISQNAQLAWPFLDTGGWYTTTKIVYMSPLFFNMLDFGVSFEPSTANLSGSGNCPYGVTYSDGLNTAGTNGNSLGCDAASASSYGNEYKRRRNTFDAAVRLRTSFGPVGAALEVGTVQSGKVLDNATPQRAVQYDGISLYDVGAQLTFGGLAVGGHFLGGRGLPGAGLAPKHSADQMSFVLGSSYAIGPVVAGFQLLRSQSAGSWTSATPASVGKVMTDQGVAVGSTLSIAPGAYLFLSYLYGHRHQAGVDILSGTVSTTATGAGVVRTNNNVQSQMIIIGTMFRW